MQKSLDLTDAKITSNIKEYKVSELSNLIKKTLEGNFSYIKVKGEISGLKIATSGHGYFNIKEQDSILACTCWRPVLSKVPFKMEDGIEVVVTGKLTTYAGNSRYQLNVERIEAAGAGALMQILLQRKAQLEKEGLFDQSRKKALPFLPKRIGIITSATGSVIKDMIHRISERCPTNILLWPVTVQGESSAFEVSSAINGFNRMTGELRPDVIIVARGGGSVEDLWAFNEEIVVRATAASLIPIISAIGHETDFTLIDFAADKRAPTPTAAAEFAVPVLSDLKVTLEGYFLSIYNMINSLVRHKSTILELSKRTLDDSDRIFYARQQKLDELSFRLKSSLPNNMKIKLAKLEGTTLPTNSILKFIDSKHNKLISLFTQINTITNHIIYNKTHQCITLAKLLQTLDIKQILNRGFTITRNEGGEIISSSKLLKSDNVTVEWSDGQITFVKK